MRRIAALSRDARYAGGTARWPAQIRFVHCSTPLPKDRWGEVEDSAVRITCHDRDTRIRPICHNSVMNNRVTYRLAPDSCSYRELACFAYIVVKE